MATGSRHVSLADLDQLHLASCSCEILIPEPNITDTSFSPPRKKGGFFSIFRKSRKNPDNGAKFSNLFSLGNCNLHLLKYDKDLNIMGEDPERNFTLQFPLNLWLCGELDYMIKESLWHEVVLTSGVSRRQFVLHFEAGENFDAFDKQLKQVFKQLEYSKSQKKDLTEKYFLVAYKYRSSDKENRSEIYASTPNLCSEDKHDVTDKDITDKLSEEETENQQNNLEQQKSQVVVSQPFSPAPFQSPLLENKDRKVFTFDKAANKQLNVESEKYQTKSFLSPPSLNTLLKNISLKSIGNEVDLNDSIVSSQSDYMTMIMEKGNLGVEHWKNIGHLLETAICSGEKHHAQEYAALLAEHKIKVSIEVDVSVMKDETKDTEISLKVYIEDREASGGYISLKVRPTDTVRDLKNKMFMKHKFPVEVQRWIIGQRIPKDNETLRHCNVKISGTVVYLYLVSAKSVGLNREEVESRHAQQILPQGNAGTMLPHQTLPQLSVESGEYMQMTMGQPYSPQTPQSNISSSSQQISNRQRSMHSPSSANTLQQGIGSSMQKQVKSEPNIPAQGQGQNQPGQRVPQVHSDPSVGAQKRLQGRQQPAPAAALQRDESEIGWQCPACTYLNLPTRPGCEICSHDRPKSYVMPKDYQLREEEKVRIQQELEMEHQVQQLEAKRREKSEKESAENYRQLLAAEDRHLVTNIQEFDCPICFDIIEPGEGVILRECLHAFCKTCLQSAIQYNEEAALRCPFQDESYMCNAVLQDREVKALVPPEVFEKYLQRSLSTAESQEANSFHCKTPDCRGWCIYDDLENFFKCPVCKHENCLTCKAIHEGMNCKQYQEDIKIRASNDKAAKRTQEMLQNMVKEGEAMHCPKCQVIVQKKDGCDWIKCSICKTEICWVTKGFRWGPMGPGDISGGCMCRVNGKQCHVNCNNCH